MEEVKLLPHEFGGNCLAHFYDVSAGVYAAKAKSANFKVGISDAVVTNLFGYIKKNYGLVFELQNSVEVYFDSDAGGILRVLGADVFIVFSCSRSVICSNGAWVEGCDGLVNRLHIIPADIIKDMASTPGCWGVRDIFSRTYSVDGLLNYVDSDLTTKVIVSLTRLDRTKSIECRSLDSFVGFKAFCTKKSITRERNSGAYTQLKDKYPELFTKPYKPFAVGIHKQIMLENPDIRTVNIRNVLGQIVRHPLYCKAMILNEGGPRFNLDLSEAGIVTKHDVIGARRRLKISLSKNYDRYVAKLGKCEVKALTRLSKELLRIEVGKMVRTDDGCTL